MSEGQTNQHARKNRINASRRESKRPGIGSDPAAAIWDFVCVSGVWTSSLRDRRWSDNTR